MRTRTTPSPATMLFECAPCRLAVEVQGTRTRLRCRHCRGWLTLVRTIPARPAWPYPRPSRAG